MSKDHARVMREIRSETADHLAHFLEAAGEQGLDPIETRVLLLECSFHYLSQVVADAAGLLQTEEFEDGRTRTEITEYAMEDHLRGGAEYALDFLTEGINPHSDRLQEWV